MCVLFRLQAVCALCLVTGQQFNSSATASNSLYIFSVPNKAQGLVELVRMEGNDIVDRTQLGFDVARATSTTKLVTFGARDQKIQLKVYDLKSGKMLSDVDVTNLEVTYIPVLIGVAEGLMINKAETQVVYVGIALERQGSDQARTSRRNKALSSPKAEYPFMAVELSTGKSFKIDAPKGAVSVRPKWKMVRGKLGTRLEDGSFATYSEASHSFTEVTEINGIAKEWSTFIPGVGLAKEIEGGWQILSRDDLTPLDQPIDITFEAGSEKKARGIFKMASGDIGRWSVTRAGDNASDYFVFDVTSHSEVSRVRYPLAVTAAFRSEDGSQILLADEKHKKALWANSATPVTSEVDFSWASLPYLTPVFQK
jgi:hypothetical protein